MNVILTSKEKYYEIMDWLAAQPKNVIRDFPMPKELIIPVDGLPRAQLDELLSNNQDKYRKDYAESLNRYYYTSLLLNEEAPFFDKEWYVSCKPYDAQFFDTEKYTEGLREITGDNLWHFDKVETLPNKYKIYHFHKGENY